MIIHVATDHAGFYHKQLLKTWLEGQSDYEVVDHGATTFCDSDDYPDYISKAAIAVSKQPDKSRAVIFGGSGQGEAMLANQFKGVRAAVYYGGPVDILTLSRTHNNANVLSIGARFVDQEELVKLVNNWLNIPFSGEDRHIRRLSKFN